jgi:glucose dehydrogenase
VDPDYTAPTQPVSELSFNPPPLRERDMWGATLLDQMVCRISFHGYRYEGRYTPPTLNGSLVYPGNFGVFNWGSIAVDPVSEVAFTTPAHLAPRSAWRSRAVVSRRKTDASGIGWRSCGTRRNRTASKCQNN